MQLFGTKMQICKNTESYSFSNQNKLLIGRFRRMLETYSTDSNEVFEEYLCANGTIKRRPKTLIPDEKKDDDYWRRRRKNNLAAKKSREAKKAKNEDLFHRAAVLREEHERLT